MTVYALIPLLSVGAYIGLFALVLRHPHRQERRAFALYLSAAGTWSFLSFLLHLDFPFLLQYTLPLDRVLIVVFMWMGVTYYYFARVFVHRPPGYGTLAGIGCIITIATLTGFGLLPQQAVSKGGALYIEYGPYFLLLAVLSLGLVGASAILLVQYRRRVSNTLARTRVNYLLGALGVLVGASLTNFSETLSRYPIDHFGNLANAGIISYAVLRHQLLDIRVVIRRGLAYSLLAVGMTTAYLVALSVISRFFHLTVSYPNLAMATGLALIAAVLFTPLRNLAQERVEQLVFRGAYPYRKMLHQFSLGIASRLDLNGLTQSILEPLIHGLGTRWAALLMPQAETGVFRVQFTSGVQTVKELEALALRADNPLVGKLAQGGEILRSEQFDAAPESKGLWQAEQETLRTLEVELLCPILQRGSLSGILALGPKQTGAPYTHEEEELLLTMANGAAVALDNAWMLAALRRAQEEREKLLSWLVRAQEEERRRVAVELHDGVAQWLVRASYQTQVVSALLGGDRRGHLQHEMASVDEIIGNCIKELRQVLAGLRPPALEELGLAQAIEQDLAALQAERMTCRLEIEGSPLRLHPSAEVAAYRIIQEALSNVRRHARASQVHVRMQFNQKELRILVADNGQGFDLSRTLDSGVAEGHLGLLGMRERATALGGALEVDSRPGAGTRLELRLPLEEPIPLPEGAS